MGGGFVGSWLGEDYIGWMKEDAFGTAVALSFQVELAYIRRRMRSVWYIDIGGGRGRDGCTRRVGGG